MKKYLMFHPYKIIFVQNILPHDPVQRLQFNEHMLNMLQDDFAVIVSLGEAHFHLDGHLISKTANIGQRKSLKNCTRMFCIVKKLPCGVLCQRLG